MTGTPATPRRIGPESGSIRIHTRRDGMAAVMGHDLVIELTSWEATVEVLADGTPVSAQLDADPRSLRVREGSGGIKPLDEADRAEIESEIDAEILRGRPISFRSEAITAGDGALSVSGELTIAGATRPVHWELDRPSPDRIQATLPLRQCNWGIKPYSAMLGALKVADTIEIAIDISEL